MCPPGTLTRGLSAILAADLILVLGSGRIVDHGRHPGLLHRGGVCGKLYHRQFRPEPAGETVPS